MQPQEPGDRYVGRCTHCGNKEREVTVHTCKWPDDGLYTVERLCDVCAPHWGRALIELGCKLNPEPVPAIGKPGGLICTA